METVDPEQAKARLDELLDMVETGEEVVITRRGVPALTRRGALGSLPPAGGDERVVLWGFRFLPTIDLP